MIITPGVHDIPEDIYFADPVPGGSLSSSGARKLLQPAGPALFRWEQDHAPAPKKVFELGSAAHKLVLGAGPELVLVDEPRWDTKETKATVAGIREAGGIPLKRAEYEQVHTMAAAIRRHPVAGPLFSPDRGQPEKTLIWQDPETGIWRRARLDWLPHAHDGRMIVADYKTTTNASTDAVTKAIANWGYHCQQPWYLDGVEALDLAGEPTMVFVFQEKRPPYLINIVQLHPDAEWTGRELNRQAINIYADCVATGIWPGYGTDIPRIVLPRWAAGSATFEEIL